MRHAAAWGLLISALLAVGCEKRPQPPAAAPTPVAGAATPDDNPALAGYRTFTGTDLVVDGVKLTLSHPHTFEEFGPRRVTVLMLTVRPAPGGPPFTLRGLDKGLTQVDPRTGERFATDGLKLHRLDDTTFTTDDGEVLTPLRRDVWDATHQPSAADLYFDVAVSEANPGRVNYYFSPPGGKAKWVLVSLPAAEFSTAGRVQFKVPTSQIDVAVRHAGAARAEGK